MVKKLLFKIDSNGEVQMEVQGAIGTECEQLSAPFEAALGTITAREHKDSFFQQQVESETHQLETER